MEGEYSVNFISDDKAVTEPEGKKGAQAGAVGPNPYEFISDDLKSHRSKRNDADTSTIYQSKSKSKSKPNQIKESKDDEDEYNEDRTERYTGRDKPRTGTGIGTGRGAFNFDTDDDDDDILKPLRNIKSDNTDRHESKTDREDYGINLNTRSGFVPPVPNDLISGARNRGINIPGYDGQLNDRQTDSESEAEMKPKKSNESKLSERELCRKKEELIFKLSVLARQGYSGIRNPNSSMSLEELRDIHTRLEKLKKKDDGVKYAQQALLMVVATVEQLNNKFDPFGIYLDGWSVSIYEDLDQYDEVLGELWDKWLAEYEQYIGPEMKLLTMLAKSGYTFHATQATLKKNQHIVPDLEEMLARDPELRKHFQRVSRDMTSSGFQQSQRGQSEQSGQGGLGGLGGILNSMGGMGGLSNLFNLGGMGGDAEPSEPVQQQPSPKPSQPRQPRPRQRQPVSPPDVDELDDLVNGFKRDKEPEREYLNISNIEDYP